MPHLLFFHTPRAFIEKINKPVLITLQHDMNTLLETLGFGNISEQVYLEYKNFISNNHIAKTIK